MCVHLTLVTCVYFVDELDAAERGVHAVAERGEGGVDAEPVDAEHQVRRLVLVHRLRQVDDELAQRHPHEDLHAVRRVRVVVNRLYLQVAVTNRHINKYIYR